MLWDGEEVEEMYSREGGFGRTKAYLVIPCVRDRTFWICDMATK